jgi:putative chitinase
MDITLEQLKVVMPKLKNAEQILPFLQKWMAHYGISTPVRISHFLAQIAHESSELTKFKENLNYSAEALHRIWPSRFSIETSKKYARKPEMIANRAYAEKGGNGDEESGDGWKYRGRGAIQCTLKNNYALAAKDWDVDLLNQPELLEEPDFGIRSACWFWWKNGLNKLADSGSSVSDITGKINPAKLGLIEREKYFSKAFALF